MNVLIVYDSVYGHTEKIAQAIGGAIPGEVKVRRVGEVTPSELNTLDLLIVGAPTHGGRPSPATKEFLNNVSEQAIRGLSVAAFDTRLTTRWARILGFAAGKIGKSLEKKGGVLLVSPEPFFVIKGKGPLKEGELERAASWAKKIMEKKQESDNKPSV